MPEDIKQLIRAELQSEMGSEIIRQYIKEELAEFILSDKMVFKKHLQMMNGRDIQFGRSVGTKIGTATDQKLAFYGVTPIVQPANIGYVSGGVTQDAQARAVIGLIIDALDDLGLTA